MIRTMAFCLLLTVAGCASAPPKLSAPGKDAQVWNLNPGRWTPPEAPR